MTPHFRLTVSVKMKRLEPKLQPIFNRQSTIKITYNKPPNLDCQKLFCLSDQHSRSCESIPIQHLLHQCVRFRKDTAQPTQLTDFLGLTGRKHEFVKKILKTVASLLAMQSTSLILNLNPLLK